MYRLSEFCERRRRPSNLFVLCATTAAYNDDKRLETTAERVRKREKNVRGPDEHCGALGRTIIAFENAKCTYGYTLHYRVYTGKNTVCRTADSVD